MRGTSQGNQSGASSPVTVGPAPYGYNLVVPYPSDQDPADVARFGHRIRMILDANGDPALAFTYDNPNDDDDYSDGLLYFVRWDRAHYRWTAPVRIAVIGDVDGFNLTPISIAQDAGNGSFGIAFEDESTPDVSHIGVAFSSDGVTWKVVKGTPDDDQGSYVRPSLALAGGNVYLSFSHNNDGIRYVTGRQSDDPSKWTSTLAPMPGGYNAYLEYGALALDAKGSPGIAYMVTGDNDDAEVFWRPPSGAALLVTGNSGVQNDDPDIRLSFSGTQPRVVFAGGLTASYDDYDHSLWVMASPDNGTTWSRPVNVPSDGDRDLSGPIDADSGSKGQLAIITEDNGGNYGGVTCGDPRLAMSADLVNWTTCGPASLDLTNFSGGTPNVRFAGNDTLYLAFQQTDTDDGAIPLGVTVWRQPPAWVFPPPPPQN